MPETLLIVLGLEVNEIKAISTGWYFTGIDSVKKKRAHMGPVVA
jgi:hypothetical protein